MSDFILHLILKTILASFSCILYCFHLSNNSDTTMKHPFSNTHINQQFGVFFSINRFINKLILPHTSFLNTVKLV